MPANRQVSRKSIVAAGAAGAVVSALFAAGAVATATYFARRLLTPDRLKPDDIQVLAVDDDSVTITLTPESRQPGRYGLWLDGGRGHARLGEVLEVNQESRCVRRVLEGVDSGELHLGPARWNQYYFAGDPHEALGLPSRDVQIPAELGLLAAWEVPAAGGTADRWVILVHGRGGPREECLRAVPVLHDLGFTTLIPSYRNDIGAPSSSDGRYGLGISEWRDLEAAMLYAVEAGAQEIVLFGYSMGGAIVLQTLDRSWLSDRVVAVVLDAPVIDWTDVIRHHGAINRIPGPIGRLTRSLIGHPSARGLVGVHELIDVALTNWADRADELKHPTLLIHSLDDEFVPAGPSIALAAKRPDLIRFEPWRGVRHTQEWNVDPLRWNAVVREFLAEALEPR